MATPLHSRPVAIERANCVDRNGADPIRVFGTAAVQFNAPRERCVAERSVL